MVVINAHPSTFLSCVATYRQETIAHNGEKITRAKSKDEVWKIVNYIIEPKEDKKLTLKEGEKIIMPI